MPIPFQPDGIGYESYGQGGAVTQATSRTTGVTLNKLVGQITLVSAAGSATVASFNVSNSKVTADDAILLWQISGTDVYTLRVSNVQAGQFTISFEDKSGTTTEQPVFGFMVFKNDVVL